MIEVLSAIWSLTVFLCATVGAMFISATVVFVCVVLFGLRGDELDRD